MAADFNPTSLGLAHERLNFEPVAENVATGAGTSTEIEIRANKILSSHSSAAGNFNPAPQCRITPCIDVEGAGDLSPHRCAACRFRMLKEQASMMPMSGQMAGHA
jgi:hypothetical protein